MHESLTAIKTELNQIIAQLKKYPSDEPFGNAHQNWYLPNLTKKELIEEATSIIDFIDVHENDEFDDPNSHIADYVGRLRHLHQRTIRNLWGNEATGVIAYQATLNGLRKALNSLIPEEDPSEIQNKARKIGAQLRRIENYLNRSMPRIEFLDTHIARIENVSSVAEHLPAYVDELNESRAEISKLAEQAKQDQVRIFDMKEDASKLEENIKTTLEEARLALDRSEKAYSAATSVGLAAAFSERSEELKKSMTFWIASLVVALLVGIAISWNQLQVLSTLFKVETDNPSVIALNLVVTILSVGAPVWFAWLATKQIGQRFRLSEDYAFKASISRTYESYRREASRIDEDTSGNMNMEAKLLDSALTRLDELPLRLVELQSYGSPWHELASSQTVKKAMKEVPDFPEQIIQLARRTIGSIKPSKKKSTQTEQSEPKTEG